MIELQQLTKRYGDKVAVDGISAREAGDASIGHII